MCVCVCGRGGGEGVKILRECVDRRYLITVHFSPVTTSFLADVLFCLNSKVLIVIP